MDELSKNQEEIEDRDVTNDPFILTIRQRRLRMITGIILAIIAVMIIVSLISPFFHPAAPAIMTEKVRRAFKVQAMIIWFYYSICLLLSFSLVIIAWLYVREVRLQLLMARRDIFREMSRSAPESVDPTILIDDQ